MAKTDPEAVRNRLAEHYASLSEPELRKLADDTESLTDIAKDARKAEFARRGLASELSDIPAAQSGLRDADTIHEQLSNSVVIRGFRDLPDALLAQSILDSAGIECYLIDENVIRMDWLWSNFAGGVKLLVKEEDASAALELLDQKPVDSFDVTGVGEYKQPRCPSCNSLNVSFGEIGKRLGYATVAIGVPLPVTRYGWKCHSCDHEWHETDDSQQNEGPSSK